MRGQKLNCDALFFIGGCIWIASNHHTWTFSRIFSFPDLWQYAEQMGRQKNIGQPDQLPGVQIIDAERASPSQSDL
jgi:hypothetical protein